MCKAESIRGGILVVLLLVFSDSVLAQSPSDTNWEVWPSIKVNFDLQPKLRLQVFGETQNGEESPYIQLKTGAMLSYRMKRILTPHMRDNDGENEYNLVVGIGYEFLHSTQDDNVKRENRLMIQATPRYLLPANILGQDRSRIEFRWVNGVYDVRYRNKLTISRTFRISRLRLGPYTSGELFYDRNHHSWNENQYAFGVQSSIGKLLTLDTFYLRQNCTTCSQDPLNVFGVTVNLYFGKRK